MTPTPRRRRIKDSEAIRKVNLDRRIRQPIILKSEDLDLASRIRVFNPPNYGHMNVDERYQRTRVTPVVNELTHVLKGGGVVPDPIHVAERPDGTLWILDGQQRYWAHSDCHLPLRAYVHSVATLEQEKAMFLILNNRMKVRGDVTVKSWPGISGPLILKLGTEPGGILAG